MDMEKGGHSLKVKIKKPAHVMMSSDYSQQEPKLTAFVSQSPQLIGNFQQNKDIYATLSSVAFNRPYEECLEFHPETHELQPEGKKLRGQGKILVLGRPEGYVILPEYIYAHSAEALLVDCR